MKVKQIYNPSRVREGWFESNFITPWFRRYTDFRGHESGKSFGLALLAWLTATAGIAGVLMGLVGLLGPEVGFVSLYVAGGLWLAYSLIPLAALLTRTFGASGDKEDIKPVTKMLGIDWMLTVCAVLFFIFGLLMMTTTLNSETLHAPVGSDEEETGFAVDTIVEEAIFTYQNPVIDTATPAVDTLAGDNTDMVPVEEGYDPTIEPDPEQPDTTIYF